MYRRPSKDLSVYRDGQPIEEAPIYHGIDPGITFAQGMLPGMVADYDVMAARVRTGLIEDTRWKALTWQERARVIAFYRLEKLVGIHIEEARATAELDAVRNRAR